MCDVLGARAGRGRTPPDRIRMSFLGGWPRAAVRPPATPRRLPRRSYWLALGEVSMTIGHLIVAGPQAAGKSTFMRVLCTTFNHIISLEESRQIVVHKYQRKGAIFMTQLDEVEVVRNDLARMWALISRIQHKGDFYVDETAV